jgi:1-acyl-sn-glycerol-3-phosphate acyltransferase
MIRFCLVLRIYRKEGYEKTSIQTMVFSVGCTKSDGKEFGFRRWHIPPQRSESLDSFAETMRQRKQSSRRLPGETTSPGITDRWYRFFHWSCQWIYFSQIRLIHPERLSVEEDRPVLYLSLHRNGALDGFIHHALFPRIRFLISRNLRRNWFLRIFFGGIEVVRRKDSLGPWPTRRAATLDALNRCQSLLAANGQLLIFPEGTSGLGPRHLPMQSGAARILLRFLEENPGRPISVVPLGIHYECAWAFRSRAEVTVGHSIATNLDPAWSKRRRLDELQKRIVGALEAVGVNFCSARHQELAERLAYVSTLRTDRSYAESLKRFESLIPESMQAEWHALETAAKGLPVWHHQGLPLFTLKRSLLPAYGLLLILMAPLVALAALLNAPPLLASLVAGKICADDANVIALWRLLIGIPVSLIWILVLGIVAGLTGHALLFACYPAASLAGLWTYHRMKKIAVVVHNGLRVPCLEESALKFQRSVTKYLSHENTLLSPNQSMLRAGCTPQCRPASCPRVERSAMH